MYSNNISEIFQGLQQLKFSVHPSGDGGLLAVVDSILTFLQEGVYSAEGFDLLPGFADMANIHPLIVHFPIAMLTSFLILELFATVTKNERVHIASSWMLYVGTLGALATVVAGFLAASTVSHGSAVHEIIGSHKQLGLSVLGLSVILTVWRLVSRERLSGMALALNITLAVIMVGLLTMGADLGGQMVYKYGVGVGAVSMEQAEEYEFHRHE